MIEFASIAYGNRERWYLASGSGHLAENKMLGIVWGIMCQKRTTKCGALAQFFTSDDPCSISVCLLLFAPKRPQTDTLKQTHTDTHTHTHKHKC